MATNNGGPAFPVTIDDLELSGIATRRLKANGIETFEQLCCTTPEHLMAFPRFSKIDLREVRRKLEDFGLSVGCGKVAYDAMLAARGAK